MPARARARCSSSVSGQGNSKATTPTPQITTGYVQRDAARPAQRQKSTAGQIDQVGHVRTDSENDGGETH